MATNTGIAMQRAYVTRSGSLCQAKPGKVALKNPGGLFAFGPNNETGAVVEAVVEAGVSAAVVSAAAAVGVGAIGAVSAATGSGETSPSWLPPAAAESSPPADTRRSGL